MLMPEMNPPPTFGSGAIEGRYELKPSPALPWYYDQTKSTAAMLVAVILILIVGNLM